MVNYLMNLTEISTLQILDNLFPQKKISTTMNEMLTVMLPTGIPLLPLSHSHLSKICYPMHLSPDFEPQSSIIWRFEVAVKTGSVLCRITLWDCFRRRILARLVVLCNLITANKTSEFSRHSHNAIRQTVPSLTCNPQRVVSSTEQIYRY